MIDTKKVREDIAKANAKSIGDVGVVALGVVEELCAEIDELRKLICEHCHDGIPLNAAGGVHELNDHEEQCVACLD